ncbi:MAG: permease [Acidaminococcaceae bacterium]
MNIFDFLNNQLLKMEWLSNLVKFLVENVLGLSMADRLGGSLHFFIYDVIKIFILLSFLIFVISYVQSYFPPERTKKILGRFNGFSGNVLGALLGTVTPFCSCSSIPLFIGFTSAGLPLSVTFSFLISSPLVDIASVILLASIFNWKIAIAYVVVGLVLAVIGGTIIGKMEMEKYVEPFVYGNKPVGVEYEPEELTRKERIDYAIEQALAIITRVWRYVLLGVGIGALIHNWIPETVISAVLGQDKWYSVLVATLIGVPMYADIFGTLPIAEALVGKGVGLGTALSFMMGVTALSLPSMIMLEKVVKTKLLGTFVGIVTLGIIIIGYTFNAFTYLFL